MAAVLDILLVAGFGQDLTQFEAAIYNGVYFALIEFNGDQPAFEITTKSWTDVDGIRAHLWRAATGRVVFGHSYGASTAAALARMTAVPVDLLVTLDAVGAPKQTSSISTTKTWINVFADVGLATFAEHPENAWAQLGGHWGAVPGATINLASGTCHAATYAMSSKAEIVTAMRQAFHAAKGRARRPSALAGGQ